jgi:hypothetical protein
MSQETVVPLAAVFIAPPPFFVNRYLRPSVRLRLPARALPPAYWRRTGPGRRGQIAVKVLLAAMLIDTLHAALEDVEIALDRVSSASPLTYDPPDRRGTGVAYRHFLP